MRALWIIAAVLMLQVRGVPGSDAGDQRPFQYAKGGIIRGPVSARKVALAFTGHEYAEGAETILRVLKGHKAKASFFLTGAFLSNTNHDPIIRRIVLEGHYLGPHSDQHLLYLPWDGSTNLLVSRGEFEADLEANLRKIVDRGVARKRVRYFLPPYEHYSSTISEWTRGLGLTLINLTPGTRSNADYTGEAERNFVPSKTIHESILAREAADPQGLNGFLLLLHLGAGPTRTDKFHLHFASLLDELGRRGYKFVRVDSLLDPN